MPPSLCAYLVPRWAHWPVGISSVSLCPRLGLAQVLLSTALGLSSPTISKCWTFPASAGNSRATPVVAPKGLWPLFKGEGPGAPSGHLPGDPMPSGLVGGSSIRWTVLGLTLSLPHRSSRWASAAALPRNQCEENLFVTEIFRFANLSMKNFCFVL